MTTIKISREMPIVWKNDECFDCPFIVNDKMLAKYLKSEGLKPALIKKIVADNTFVGLTQKVGFWINSEYNVNAERELTAEYMIFTF